MARNDFTNPAVLKAESELRYALVSYETMCMTYKVLCINHNVMFELYKIPDNRTKDMNDILKETDEKMVKAFETLQALQINYIEKITAYKSLMGL